jgi:DNA repair photolyase
MKRERTGDKATVRSPLTTIERVEAKSIVRSEPGSRDIHLNPYQGCYHDCAYCDGKAERYYMHADFGTRVRAKVNAPRLLEDYLRKEGYTPVNRGRTGTLGDFSDEQRKALRRHDKFRINISGGVCDIYQPAEAEVQLSRRLLQVVHDYDFPVFLLTKSTLVLRDVDLLKKINESHRATVAMTVTLMDDSVRAVFEPRASPTHERFAALRELHEEGIHTGIWALPLLPWIGDSDENIDGIMSSAKAAGVEWIICDGLTMKPGRQKEAFMRVIGERYPELLSRYQRLFANDDKYGKPDLAAAREMGIPNPYRKGRDFALRHGIAYKSWSKDEFGQG